MKFPAFEPIDLKNNLKTLNVIELSLSQILPDQNQPRKNFEPNLLDELSQSIKQHGVIQPILVKKILNSDNYKIVAGERRWRASKLAGKEKIPVIVCEYDTAETFTISLIENIQRENLNPLEEAQAIKNLLEECSMTHNQIAEKIGKSRTTISNLLRLLNLEIAVQKMVNLGSLEMGHARALLSLAGDKQIMAAELIIKKKYSVRETEKFVQRININIRKKQVYSIGEFESKIKKCEENLSVKIKFMISSKGKGKIILHFDSLTEAAFLIDKLSKG